MTTMVDEPYVTHVPTLAGGVGGAGVRRFYRDHFIGHWPDDVRITHVRAPPAPTAWWTRW